MEKFEIEGDMLVYAFLQAFIVECAANRGHLQNSNGGVFLKPLDNAGNPVFDGTHGAYQKVADAEDKYVEKFIHTVSGSVKLASEFDVPLLSSIEIHDNHDDVNAYVIVIGKKIHMNAFFPDVANLKKTTVDQRMEIVSNFSNKRKEAEPSVVVVTAATSEASKRRRTRTSAPGGGLTSGALEAHTLLQQQPRAGEVGVVELGAVAVAPAPADIAPETVI